MSGLAKIMKSRSVVFILLILAVLAIGLIYNYGEKFTASEPMETSNGDVQTAETEPNDVDAVKTEAPPCGGVSQNPSDLLPSPASGSNGWDVLDTVGTSAGANPDLLEAGHHSGIDTVGQSLRNANLQVRSDPQIPLADTGPWNQSTIEATNVQVPFNLGQ